MKKDKPNKELKEAIELLEDVHRYINNGYMKQGDRVELLPHTDYRNRVYSFVKKHKENTKLKPIKTGNLWA